MRTSSQVVNEVKERTKPPARAGAPHEAPSSRKTDARVVLKGLTSGMKPEEKYIQERLEDGTCYMDPAYSLKAIGAPSIDFQARSFKGRTEKIDPGHASRLAAILAGFAATDPECEDLL